MQVKAWGHGRRGVEKTLNLLVQQTATAPLEVGQSVDG